MSVHLSEDEQLERMKRWWADNGKSTIIALAIFLAAWFGYDYYQNTRIASAEQASSQYAQLESLFNANQGTALSADAEATAWTLIDTLKSEAKGTYYAQAAALFGAKLAADKNELAKAESELNWVLAAKPEAAIAQIATFRLARVLLASDQADKALALVASEPAAAFISDHYEIRGDILKKQGKLADAHAAYDRAIKGLTPEQQSRLGLLKAKADDVKSPDTQSDENAQ